MESQNKSSRAIFKTPPCHSVARVPRVGHPWFSRTNVDGRGIKRGSCRDEKCDCEMYESPSQDGVQKCAYCFHAPSLHTNSGKFNDVLAVVPVKISNTRNADTEEILSRIARAIAFINDGIPKYKTLFPPLKSHREETIKQLREIADYLDLTKSNCNISKTVGASVGLAGGVTAVVATVIAGVSTGGLALIPIAIGSTGALLGGACSVGTSITEFSLVKTKVAEAENVWKMDKLYLKDLLEFVKQARQCKQDIELIMDYDKFKEAVIYINQECNGKYNLSSFKKRYENLKFHFHVDNRSKLISDFLRIFEKTSSINVLFEKNTDTIGVVNVISDVGKITMHGIRMADVISDIVMGSANIAARVANSSFQAGAKTLSQVALGAGIVFDIITLVGTISDMAGGSKSELADQFRTTARELQLQIDELEKVYNGLVRFQLEVLWNAIEF